MFAPHALAEAHTVKKYHRWRGVGSDDFIVKLMSVDFREHEELTLEPISDLDKNAAGAITTMRM